MNASNSVRFLPNLGRALRAALQWRLLLWWVLLMLIPTVAALLPVWRWLGAQLDNSVHAGEWAHQFDIVMLYDLATLAMGAGTAFAGASTVGIVLLLVLIPLLNALFIAATRSATPMKMGELLREGLRYYWRMFRMMLMALLPVAIVILVARLCGKGLAHYSEHAVLESQVEHWKWAMYALLAVVFALANGTVDAARASLALEPARRSVVKAWWRGLKLIARHPLRSLVLYLGVTALAGVALAIALWLRLGLQSASFTGLLLGLLIAQLITAIFAWMHYARLFGMAELTRALVLKPASGINDANSASPGAS
jgi:MFS family permease